MQSIKFIPLTSIILALILLFLALLPVVPTAAQSPPPPEFVPGEVLVKFRPETGAAKGQILLQGLGYQTLAVSSYSGLLRVQVPAGQEARVAAELAARPEVEFAELNRILTLFNIPDDTEFAQQWNMHNTGQTGGQVDADIDAPEAWDIETGSPAVVIAIVDSGADLDHEDLQANIWVNPGETPGNAVDDDGNGFVDDVNGWDFCNSTSFLLPCAQPGDNDPNDAIGHGTHVTGIAGAVGNNGKGVSGVSWQASLMPLKVFDQFSNTTLASVANGIDYAAANGAHIINLSLGNPNQAAPCASMQAIVTAIKNATSQGMLVVAASGNASKNFVGCPAALDEVIAVAATTPQDTRWTGSNFGIHLDVSAPGVSIYSTSFNPALKYQLLTGTSMASPHVAGLAGLLWAYDPALSDKDVRTIIEATVDDLGTAGYDVFFGHGRINAYQALSTLVSLTTTPPKFTFILKDGDATPVSQNIRLISADLNPVTWTRVISPPVSWLTLPPSAPIETISLASSPLDLPVTATFPVTYGVYSTTVVISGINSAGKNIGIRTTEVSLIYIADDLEVSPSQLSFSVADNATSVPVTGKLQLSTAASSPITWTSLISPPVSWLQAISPTNGTLSTTTSPVEITLTVTRPITYGVFATTLLLQGSPALGSQFAPQPVQLSIIYTNQSFKLYFPIFFPGGPPEWWPFPKNTQASPTK